MKKNTGFFKGIPALMLVLGLLLTACPQEATEEKESVPSVPTGVTAAAASSSSITVTWTAVTGAASYKVYRSTSENSGYEYKSNPSAVPYTDTELTAATTYYYKVSALNAAGESAQSGSASAQTAVSNGEEFGISWDSEPDGTLTMLNNASKDMVIFTGPTPSSSNILGGVRALSTRVFDVSDDVDDFNVGGYLILRGMPLDEYMANKTNLGRAKVEYSAMATYGQGKKYRTEINSAYTGDYAYRVTNLGRIGMELRKDSPDGEKIGYLSSLESNMMLYTDTTDGFAIYPVFVYYNKRTSQVSTLKPTSQFETVSVSPRPATDSQIQGYTLPADAGASWDSIKASLSSPVAYVTITNSVPNQSGRVTLSGTNRLNSQNGYDSIGSGETLTYEIKSTDTGSQQALIVTYYNQALQIPIKHDGAAPTLKNGFDYTISVSGSGQDPSGYTVTFSESATARDLSSEIESL